MIYAHPRRLSFAWLLSVISVGLLGVSAWAQDYEAIEARIQGFVSDPSTVVINETPIEGVLEVRLGGEVVYMSEDGRHLFQGRLFDLETRMDLTGQAQSEMRQAQIAQIDESQFVTFGPKNPTHRLMVFTDPDCGFCRRLHEQMDSYIAQGIEINYMGFPRAGENSKTFDTLVSIWCSANPRQAMDLAKAGEDVPEARCDHPVSEHYALGKQLGVTGTPALLTFDGTLIPGFVPALELKARLDDLAANP